MAKPKKPTLQRGEYGEKHIVEYNHPEDPELSGKFEVELGAEYKDEQHWHTRRSVRVNGHAFNMYAMVREEGKYVRHERRIERDESVLRHRAVETYAGTVLRDQVEKHRRDERKRAYEASLLSPANWVAGEGKLNGSPAVRIEPISLAMYLNADEPEANAQKKKIMNRIVELLQRYGFEDAQ